MMEKVLLMRSSGRFGQRAAMLLFPMLTLVLAATTVMGRNMSAPMVVALLAGGVVCLGLPHGSLDPLVARRLFRGERWFTMVRFFVLYAFAAALCVVGWLAAPTVALGMFLLISAWHFGSDWEQRGSFWGRAAYGTCVVSVSTLRHSEEVRRVYVELGATAAAGIVSVSKVVAVVAVLVALFSLLSQIRIRRRDGWELGVILIGGLVLQPLVFFVCYFCLLHSPRHLAMTARGLGMRGWGGIAVAAAPTVIATLVLAAAFWHFLPSHRDSSRMIQVVFIGLAALTVPHMLLAEMDERAQEGGRRVGP